MRTQRKLISTKGGRRPSPGLFNPQLMYTCPQQNWPRAVLLSFVQEVPCAYFRGPEDVAYPNAKNNVELINHVPVSFASIPVGHGGTYGQPHGGIFATVTTLWLDYQLKGKEDSQRFFVDKSYQKTWYPEWEILRKNW